MQPGIGISFFGILIILAAGFFFLLFVALLVLLIRRGRHGVEEQSNDSASYDRRAVDRKKILERLARKEITDEEAERLLDQAGEPIPGTPPPPPQRKCSNTRGCLIVVLILLAVPVLLFIALFALKILFGMAFWA